MCFYGWGLGPPIVHVPSPCVSMDGGLGPSIFHAPLSCVSMDGVEDLLLFMFPFYVFLWMGV